MSANLENSAVATGLEKISFHSNPKERQCRRMFKLPHNCTHLMVFPVVMYACESWTIKKTEGQRIDSFELVLEKTSWDHMDCSLPGFLVCGIFQARVLEWVAISFSRGSSQPRDWTWVSRIAGRHFTIWATREMLCTKLFQKWWLEAYEKGHEKQKIIIISYGE